MNGRYRVKDDKLKQLYILAKNLIEYFKEFKLEYIEREKNQQADKLAMQAVRKKK